MIGLSWICQGVGNPRKVQMLCELNKTCKPDFIFLFENLANSTFIEMIKLKLGFEGAVTMNCIG